MPINDNVTVTGHTYLTADDFEKYYVPTLKVAIDNGGVFHLGIADGADRMAYEMIKQSSKDTRVYLYGVAGKARPSWIPTDQFVDETSTSYTARDNLLQEICDNLIGYVYGSAYALGSGSARNIAAFKGRCVDNFYEIARRDGVTAEEILEAYPVLRQCIME